jgi:5,5'-dehydrodivanillate O-demethylase
MDRNAPRDLRVDQVGSLVRPDERMQTNPAHQREQASAEQFQALVPEVTFEDLVHVGPGTLGGRYWRRFWQPIYRVADLPAGAAIPLTILGERFTLYRGHAASEDRGMRPHPRPLPEGEGTAHLVAFRCAHRGTQLSVGWVEEDCIRCRYHGWKYDATGQCVEQPGEDPDFAARVRIRAYPTREYVGLIFAYLGDDEAPPFRSYPDLDAPGVVVTDPPEYLPCSFWNRIDNDAAHGAWTHRSSAIRMNRPDFLIQRIDAIEETEYGYIQRREGFSSGHIFMPNGRLFWIKTRARGYEGRQDLVDTKFSWTVPVDDDHFVAFDVTVSPLQGEEARAYADQRRHEQEPEAESRWDIAEQILAGDLRIEDIPDDVSHYNGFAIEDYVTQVGQGRFPDRSNEWLGRIDARVVINRTLWLRELTALAQGRPLTAWRIPEQPLRPPLGTRFV